MSKSTGKSTDTMMLSALCEAAYDGLYAYILRHSGGDVHLTEEIVQETFMCALEKQDELLPHPNPKGWLYETAKIFYMRHRSKKTKIAKNEESLYYRTEDEDDSEMDKYSFGHWVSSSQNDGGGFLEELFSRITEDEKELLLLHHVDGKSLVTIAGELGQNYGKLQKSYHRLMQRVKKLAEEIIRENSE